MPSVQRFTSAISIAGCALLAAVLASATRLVPPHAALEVALLAPGVVLGELLPLKIPRRGDDEELTISTTFAFALLLAAGLPAALVAQAVASVIQDVAARKPLWRIPFNVGQYTLSLGAAAGVLHVMGRGTPPPLFDPLHVLAIAGAAVAFWLVNVGVVGVAIALYQRTSLVEYFRSDLAFSAYTGAVLLCLAPVLLAAIYRSVALYPACLLPLVALYQGGRQAARSERQARHDTLTGLANRARLRGLIEHALADARRDGGRFAVLLMDLDRFKDINDTLGHHVGDLLLKQVAERLVDSVRTEDAVARIGGDEFVVLVGDACADGVASAVAGRIAAALEAPFVLEDFAMQVQASMGIAGYPEDGTDGETLLQHADIAMYHAKRQHLDHVTYAPEFDHHSPARLALAGELRRALSEGEIEPFYQPQADLSAAAVRSVEALARWRHPTLGLLAPASFLEVAESTGLIRDLTLRVLDRALADRQAWAAGGLDVVVAINLSMRSLLDRGFPAAVGERLAAAGTSADRLRLEITESTIMADPETATAVVGELAAMGVELAIDDFGTGYSSLAYLRRLSVSELKIDRSFVATMGSERDDATIVTSTIDLGHNLGLRVIAEGVEDVTTLETLAGAGCDGAQGYLLGRPVPAEELPRTVAGGVDVLERAARMRPSPPAPRLREVS